MVSLLWWIFRVSILKSMWGWRSPLKCDLKTGKYKICRFLNELFRYVEVTHVLQTKNWYCHWTLYTIKSKPYPPPPWDMGIWILVPSTWDIWMFCHSCSMIRGLLVGTRQNSQGLQGILGLKLVVFKMALRVIDKLILTTSSKWLMLQNTVWEVVQLSYRSTINPYVFPELYVHIFKYSSCSTFRFSLLVTIRHLPERKTGGGVLIHPGGWCMATRRLIQI